MRMKSRWVLAAVTALLAIALTSCSSSTGNGIVSGTGFMWVATQGDQMINAFNINLSTGAVGLVGHAAATGATPSAMAIAPDGKTFFVSNSGDSTIGVYTVGSDGSLTAAQGGAVVTGQSPMGLAVDPADNLLFVANQGADTISVFAIGTGTLTPKTSFPVQTPPVLGGSGPVALALSPASFSCSDTTTQPATARSCFSLYAANQAGNTVTAYDYFVDSSGNVVLGSVDAGGNFVVGGTVAGSPYQVGNNPSGLAFSRCAGITSTTKTTLCPTADANSLFVANSGSNNVSVFTACIQASTACPVPNGSLTAVGLPVAAGNGPVAFIVDPAANFVYAVDKSSFQVSQYSYGPATGALTSLSPAAASTGSTPVSGGITSNGAWVFVANNGGSSLSAFSVGTGGLLSPATAPSITLSGQPSAMLVK
jgi:DNA-binding beta-propeller fold protein YncE